MNVYIAHFAGKKIEIVGTTLYGATQQARISLKVPKSKQGLLSVELAEKDGKRVTTTLT